MTKDYIKRQFSNFYNEVIKGNFVDNNKIVSILSTGSVDLKLTFEQGYIVNATGKNSASVHWQRTNYFSVDNPCTISATRVNDQKTNNALYLYEYEMDSTFIAQYKLVSSYKDDNVSHKLDNTKKYRIAMSYTEDSIYNYWDLTLVTDLATLIDNVSNTTSRIENVTVAEFNSRDAQDNAMINNAQYNIYSNPFLTVYDGKVGTFLSERNYLTKFALLSDAHIGGEYYDATKKERYIQAISHINSLGVDFTIELGDNVDSGYSDTNKVTFNSQINEHKDVFSRLDSPLFPFGGNHDTGVANYSPYGTIDFNDVRIIKFHADYAGLAVPSGQSENVWSTGIVTEEQLAYIQHQLETSKAKVNIVACHYPIATDDTYTTFKWWIQNEIVDRGGNTRDGNRDELLQILNDNHVLMYLSGHEHTTLYDNFGKVGDINNYNSPSFQTGYTIVTVKENEIVFDYFDIATNTSQGTRTISLQ